MADFSAHDDVLGAHEEVRQVRAPYDSLLRETVTDVLAQYPFVANQPIVEIGAGMGQLRRWLPQPYRDRAIHTEPSAAALSALRRAMPETRTLLAKAQKLPLTDASCGGIVALCVFDAIGGEHAQATAVAEIARVLAPGTCFIHLLDLGALLDPWIDAFNARGLIPVPNVFGHPDEGDWPVDVVLFERDWAERLLLFSQDAAHPFFLLFAPYFSSFLLQPFDRREALARFKTLASDSATRRMLALQTASVLQVAAANGVAMAPAIPFASSLELARTMTHMFAHEGRFEIEFEGLVKRQAVAPADRHETARYRRLCVGHEHVSDRPPATSVGIAGGPIASNQTVKETAVFCFVARRK